MGDRFKFRIWDGKQFLYTTPHEDSWYNGDNQGVWKKCVDVEQMFPDIQPCSGIKDKNGMLIFRDDICEVEVTLSRPHLYIHELRTGVIRIQSSTGPILIGYKAFDIENNKPTYKTKFTKIAGYRTKVIGNIHQHKHLLE